MMRRLLCALACALLFPAAPAAAQSLFGMAPLGLPTQPVDAAGRALGGVGVGMWDLGGSVVNPAIGAGLVRRGGLLALENSAVRTEFNGASDEAGATRFPLLQVFVPVGGGFVLQAAYGAFLDQSWAIESTSVVDIEGEAVTARDIVESRGGISQIRVGVAYAISPAVGVGAAIGFYGGEQDFRVTRRFDADEESPLLPFTTRWVRSYSAPLVSVGARWTPSQLVRTGASVTWGGTLTTRSQLGDAPAAEHSLPIQVAGGVSARLAPTLIATAAGEWAGWDAAGEGMNSWRVGGGVELRGVTLRQRVMPIRLGGGFAQLPFALEGGIEPATEWTAALGAGAILAGDQTVPLARADATVERGARDAGVLSDEFWRLTVTFSVFAR